MLPYFPGTRYEDWALDDPAGKTLAEAAPNPERRIRELGVKDVVASLQRIFKVSSPTSGTFYAVIVGAELVSWLQVLASVVLQMELLGLEAREDE